MSALCVAALAAGLTWRLDVERFDLVWTHSVEKTEWRETWQVGADRRLHLLEAAIQGSGAGMEPPPEARLIEGWWVWQPSAEAGTVESLALARSGVVADYRLCIRKEHCAELSALLPGLAADDSVMLTACT